MSRMTDLNVLALPDLYRELAAAGGPRRLFQLAHDEDLGERGDVTSGAIISEASVGTLVLRAREPGVAAGLAALPELLAVFGPTCVCEAAVQDGSRFESGTVLARFRGPLRNLLALERTMLNLLSRLCGIATRTAQFVEVLGHSTKARLYDTRKTTPGLRALEKYAVRCGGGNCHRVGLFDAVLIKDNHLAGLQGRELADAVSRATVAAHAKWGDRLRFVEVEVDSLAQLRAIFEAKAAVDIVLLDNMRPPQLREASELRDAMAPAIELEASGGVTLNTVREIGSTGVDRISVGSLTQGATCLDLGLDES